LPLSKPRFGKAQYELVSPQGVNGLVVAPQEGSRLTLLESAAEPAGTEREAAAAIAANTYHRRLEPNNGNLTKPQEQSAHCAFAHPREQSLRWGASFTRTRVLAPELKHPRPRADLW